MKPPEGTVVKGLARDPRLDRAAGRSLLGKQAWRLVIREVDAAGAPGVGYLD